jgi:Flp pilus assembly protein TadD
MARKSYGDAVTQYEAAFGRQKDTDGALRLFWACAQSGNVNKGNALLESWVKAQPGDTQAARALAEGYVRAGNLSAAKRMYEQVLKVDNDDAASLNNLANILLREGDGKALDYAERAYKLAPKDGAIQDTLGWVLVQRGQTDKGLRHLQEARLRAPENLEIRYHLAAALSQAGRREEAKRELEPAIKGLGQSAEASEARKLWNELASR